MIGSDLSFLPQLEACGAQFRDTLGVADAMTILARHGFGWVRLRLWHRPTGGHSGLGEVLAMARRARQLGLGIMFDLHYSDTWADPRQQTVPVAWQGLPFEAIEDSVFRYTRDACAALGAEGAPPNVVQLGNEIRSGLMWDYGRVGGRSNTPFQWRQLARLLRAGARGVHAGAPHARILLHVDHGGDPEGNRAFFDRMVAEDVPFEMIGVSYYPWWHGGLDRLERTLTMLGRRYRRDVVVVETAYPWTLEYFDGTHNVVGTRDAVLPEYPATPDGQAALLKRVLAIVAGAPRGRGVFYWAPDAIAVPGFGSASENLALFDTLGVVLPGVAAWSARNGAGRTKKSGVLSDAATA